MRKVKSKKKKHIFVRYALLRKMHICRMITKNFKRADTGLTRKAYILYQIIGGLCPIFIKQK